MFIYGPELSIDYDISDHFRIWTNASYDLASSNNRPRLTFEGADGSSDVDIDETNPRVTYNDELVESLPYDASGLRLTVGS